MNRLVLALVLCAAAPAAAWDGATTHAGMTQRAAEAADLHRVLVDRFGLPLGLFEPLRLGAAPGLAESLAQLDPADGLVPDASGALPALSWLIAGSILEEMPPARVRHHFFDPRTGKGLSDRSLGTRIWLGLFGSRELGGPFDLTGRPAPEWAAAADNELGLPRTLDALEAAVSGKTPAERQAALARGLVGLGAILHLVQDMGTPAHVRNDFRVGHLEHLSSATFDRGSRLEAFVARALGRLGVARPKGEPPRFDRFAEHFRELALFTQRGFLSPGSLPPVTPVGAQRDPGRVSEALARTTPFAGPAPRALRLEDGSHADGGAAGVLARVELRDGRVRLLLDERTDEAYAAALVPKATQAAAGLLAFLLRGSIGVGEGGRVTIEGTSVRGKVTVLAEDEQGARRTVFAGDVTARPGEPLVPGSVTELAGNARRIAVVVRGVDHVAEPLVVSRDWAVIR